MQTRTVANRQRMARLGARLRVWVLLVCVAWVGACGTQGSDQPAAENTAESTNATGKPAPKPQQGQPTPSTQTAAAAHTTTPNKADPSEHTAPEASTLLVTTPAQLVWLDLLEAVYAERRFAPLLVNHQGLNESGEALLAALSDADAHALDPKRYHLPLIVAELEALQNDEPGPLHGTLQPLTRPLDVLLARVWQTLGASGGESSGSALQRWRLAQIEVLLADALLSYAHDMKHANLNDLTDEVRAQHGDAHLIRERLLKLVKDTDAGKLPEVLPQLIPAWTQYQRLLPALQKYRALMADIEDWPRLEKIPKRKFPLTKGEQGQVIEQLQMRLTAEGFYNGPMTATLDKETQEALKHYQRTHQLKDDGELDEGTHSSLNVPLPVRVAEIEVSLERWRQTLLKTDEPYYIFVNVPDFHGELWRDGKLIHRFRVIVGATARYFSEEREETLYTQATPLMTNELNNIIFNPTWTVPEDIRKNEHPAELARDPRYYEKNGFDVIRNGNHVMVRQRPGPNNALGFVKFVFPNDHNIYMHDTPMRGMFRHPVRAFSHGCVRVHEPLLFAEILMREDGETRAKYMIDRYIESGRTGDYTLKKAIPVHIDYIVVRVEDDGEITFGTDVYRRERPLIKEHLVRMGLEPESVYPDPPVQ